MYANEPGCGDSVTVQFWMNEIPNKPIIILKDSVLSASAAASYQWYDDNGLIAGAMSREYQPDDNGSFWVVVANDSGCMNNSDTFVYDLISARQHMTRKTLKVYPNPAAGSVKIEYPGSFTVSISSLDGRLLKRSVMSINAVTLSLEGLPKGPYLLLVDSNDGILRRVLLKQ